MHFWLSCQTAFPQLHYAFFLVLNQYRIHVPPSHDLSPSRNILVYHTWCQNWPWVWPRQRVKMRSITYPNYYYLSVLGIEPSSLCMLGKLAITELHPYPTFLTSNHTFFMYLAFMHTELHKSYYKSFFTCISTTELHTYLTLVSKVCFKYGFISIPINVATGCQLNPSWLQILRTNATSSKLHEPPPLQESHHFKVPDYKSFGVTSVLFHGAATR